MFNGGIFGDTFDFDHDGHLDSFERTMDVGFFVTCMEQEEQSRLFDGEDDEDDYDFDFDEDEDDPDDYY